MTDVTAGAAAAPPTPELQNPELQSSQPPSLQQPQPDRRARLVAVLAWLAVATTLLYVAWVVAVALGTVAALLGITSASTSRSVPPLFVLHAGTGAASLAAGALQLRLVRRTVPAHLRVHRAIGRTYVYASWATSLAGLVVTAGFDIGLPAKVAFALEAALWFAATTLAYRCARRRRFARHARWMIRSYALALFFITFSLIQPTVTAIGVDRTSAYTLSILASVAVNLALAQWAIRATRVAAGDLRP